MFALKNMPKKLDPKRWTRLGSAPSEEQPIYLVNPLRWFRESKTFLAYVDVLQERGWLRASVTILKIWTYQRQVERTLGRYQGEACAALQACAWLASGDIDEERFGQLLAASEHDGEIELMLSDIEVIN